MNQPPNRKPSESRSSIRTDARLDQPTRQNVDDLAQHFHQPRAAVLCQIMQWGLNRRQAGPIDLGDAQGPVHHLYLYVAADLYERVEKAATAAGVHITSWLRHMVRQISAADVPASWQEATPRERSHDSRVYGTRFMLRLDKPSQTKLQQLIQRFGASKADIIRQLIMQATSEDFPTSWQMRATERSVLPIQRRETKNKA